MSSWASMDNPALGGAAVHRCIFVLAETLLVLSLASCNRGSGPPGPGPSPSPSFSISLSPQNQTVGVGQSATVNISVDAQNGFNQTITVSLTGLPNGVTSTPASPFSITLTGKQVTFTSSSSTSLGGAMITFNATSGNLTSSAQLTLTVAQGPPGLPNTRTSFVPTDDTPLAVVYDPVHQLIFASALHLNCVDVISTATGRIITCVPVSGALGLSLAADGKNVLVGTQVGIVAWIDTTSLQVVKRATIPQIPSAGTLPGLSYVAAAQAFQAANGKILLFSNWGYEDLHGNLKSASVVEWDPVAGTSTPRPDSQGGGLVSMSADHSKILIAGQGSAVVYDSNTDAFTPVPGFQAGVYEPAMNPAGTQFVLINGSPLIHFFNAQMSVVGALDLAVCCGRRPLGAVYSPDGKYLYIVLPNSLPLLVTIDTSTFQVVGTAPAFSQPNIFVVPQAADPTGLVFEIADHGVAINDATDFHDFTNANPVNGFLTATPAEGPVNQPTTTLFANVSLTTLPDVFFGSQRGLNPNLFNGTGQLQATAPSQSVPGPVNVKAVQANGVMAFMPQAFTYGAFPIQSGILASDPKGGVLADLFGYGYSVDISGASIQVNLGSSSASLQSKNIFSYIFPLQHLVVSVPSGPTGPQDITVTSPAGTAIYSKGFHYVESVIDYSSSDTFQYVLYDSRRNQVYLSAGDHIDVFSLVSNSFITPITIPSKAGTRFIMGLALTPDGSKLLAANQSDLSLAIVNPDNPASGAIAVGLPLSGMSGNPGPFQIATTSTNQAFVTITTGNAISGGVSSIYSVDLSTLQVTIPTLPAGSILNLNNNYIAGSADGKVVVEATSNNSGGPLLSWEAVTNTWHTHLVEGQFWDNAAISGDGNVLAVDSSPDSLSFPFPYLVDAQLHLTAQLNFPEFESIGEGPSLQLDQSGALLYAVNGAGVDIMDARTGQLRERVLLAEQIRGGPTEVLQTPSRTMAITPGGDKIFLLTTAGLTVVHLDVVPLGIGSVTPAAGPAGSVVTIRGAGFVAGTSVAVNGSAAVVSFVDSSTLKVTIPGTLPTGGAQFVLTNPDNSKFSLDAAFVVQ